MPSSSKLKVIVADRDRRLRDLARTFLEGSGHYVIFADNGIEALDLVEKERPNVLVTEIMLPKKDGLALCRTIKSDPNLEHTKVLIFSVLAASKRAQEAGADGFLAKPLVRDRLSSALDELMANEFWAKVGNVSP